MVMELSLLLINITAAPEFTENISDSIWQNMWTEDLRLTRQQGKKILIFLQLLSGFRRKQGCCLQSFLFRYTWYQRRLCVWSML